MGNMERDIKHNFFGEPFMFALSTLCTGHVLEITPQNPISSIKMTTMKLLVFSQTSVITIMCLIELS